MSNKTVIARPGAIAAEHLIRRRPAGTIGRLIFWVLLTAYSVMEFMAPHFEARVGWLQVLTHIFLWVTTLVGIYNVGERLLYRARYRRHVAQGEIIEVSFSLQWIWNELCVEAGIQRPIAAREAQVQALFEAAQDLRSDLVDYDRFTGDPRRKDERRLVKARIRARLMREVRLLKARQELTVSVPTPHVSANEIEEQLAILKARAELNRERPAD